MSRAVASEGRWISVWDPLVRIFHWGTVAAVATAFLTEDVGWLHEGAGYVVLALLAVRLVWGVVGTRHARFSDFVVAPGRVRSYLGALLRGRAPRHLGHNPAGGAMIVLLILLLSLTGGSGWLMTTDRFWGVGWLEQAHEAIAYLLLGAIALHVGGALAASVLHGENLVRAMITGRKRAE